MDIYFWAFGLIQQLFCLGYIYVIYNICPKIMLLVEEVWSNTTSSYKNWHNEIKWFSIIIKSNKCQKNRKEKFSECHENPWRHFLELIRISGRKKYIRGSHPS